MRYQLGFELQDD